MHPVELQSIFVWANGGDVQAMLKRYVDTFQAGGMDFCEAIMATADIVGLPKPTDPPGGRRPIPERKRA